MGPRPPIFRPLHRLAGLLLWLSSLCLPAAAWADGFPARFDATGPGLLTLRSAPSEAAGRITSMPSDREGIEVLALSEDGQWAESHFGHNPAWIPLARLSRQSDPMAQDPPLTCYGVLPFWALSLPTRFFAEFEQPEQPHQPWQITGTSAAEGPNGPTRVWTFAGEERRANLVMRREACTLPMTERRFGLSATLTTVENMGEVHLHLGCCSLTSP